MTERIVRLRMLLEKIRNKCEGTCVLIGTIFCNTTCLWPKVKAVAEQALREAGEYVPREKKDG